MYACPTCKCTDIASTAWVHYNKSVILNDEEPPTDHIHCQRCDALLSGPPEWTEVESPHVPSVPEARFKGRERIATECDRVGHAWEGLGGCIRCGASESGEVRTPGDDQPASLRDVKALLAPIVEHLAQLTAELRSGGRP